MVETLKTLITLNGGENPSKGDNPSKSKKTLNGGENHSKGVNPSKSKKP
jgi:hypothetical protein